MGTFKNTLLMGAALLTVAGVVRAEELIRTPTGVVVRSLFDWEGAFGLDVMLGGVVFPARRIEGGAEHFFRIDDICEGAGYQVSTKSGDPPRRLDHLCPQALSSQSAASQSAASQSAAGRVTFAFISDTQKDEEAHRSTGLFLHGLIEDHPEIQFVVNGGDIVDRGGGEKHWKRYRAVASTLYSNLVPIVPVAGNHDYWSDWDLENFDAVYGTPETASHYYSIDLGSALLVVLDSNADRMKSARWRAQTSWLARTLRSVAGRKPVIVTYHHPVDSSDIANVVMPVAPFFVQADWLPLFREFGVKLVLNGHTHLYERLLIDGLWHVVAGPAAGAFGGNWPMRSVNSKFLLKDVRTVTLVRIDGTGAISLVTYDAESGRIVDVLAI